MAYPPSEVARSRLKSIFQNLFPKRSKGLRHPRCRTWLGCKALAGRAYVNGPYVPFKLLLGAEARDVGRKRAASVKRRRHIPNVAGILRPAVIAHQRILLRRGSILRVIGGD